MTARGALTPGAPLAARLWQYQRERFPLAAHLPLVLVFAFAALATAHADNAGEVTPTGLRVLASVLLLLVLFFQLRVLDEFKDAPEDARYRPERPVPRGLVTLRELGSAALAGSVLQFVVALPLGFTVLAALVIAWGYALLMGAEFFARDWLKRQPLVYLLSHMVMMPLAAVLAMSPLLPSLGHAALSGTFLGLAYLNGLVLEIGRKIRAPRDERPGVETYSALWGPRRAVVAWAAAVLLALGTGNLLLAEASWMLRATLLLAAGAALISALTLMVRPDARTGRLIEMMSALWLLASFGAVAAAQAGRLP